MNILAASPADAIASRRSVRAFLPTPIPQHTIHDLLNLAARAPSGSNIQPWQVIVLTGTALQQLGQTLSELALSGDGGASEYDYYPRQWREPYQGRRRAVGWGLYSSLGIERGQKEKIQRQHARNFTFFDAPVGLLFTLDRDMEIGSWLDYGMFLQNFMIAARGVGLHTCPQAAFAQYHETISEQLNIPSDRQLICGMALGYADPKAPENLFSTERAPLSDFVRFLD